MKFTEWLKLAEIKNQSTSDSVSTTRLHAEIIQKKKFLKKVYTDFYVEFLKASDTQGNGVFVELGSGGGFLKEIMPKAITSDILQIENIDIRFSALNMPFKDKSVKAFFMVDVLHHISDSFLFFKEIDRCLERGGKVIMIEPSNTLWSRFIYKYFHPEPFDPKGRWGLEIESSPSDANGAIPWIIFFRDRLRFEKEFPGLEIVKAFSHTPFRYHIAGGISWKQLLPDIAYNLIKGIEFILSPLNRYIGMFLTIELEKVQFYLDEIFVFR